MTSTSSISTVSSGGSTASASASTASSTSSASGGGGSSSAGGAAGVDSEALVFHVNVLLLSLLALLVVLRIPRAIARLSRTAEWASGNMFRKAVLPPPVRVPQMNDSAYPDTRRDGESSSDDHTLFATAQQRVPYNIPANYPPHVAACMQFFRPIVAPFHWRFSAGYSFYQVFVCLIYLGCLAYAAFYSNNPFTDSVRFGWVVIGQLPFVFAYATKANPIGMVLGLGYEKLNFLHRFVGRVLVVSANVHAAGFIYKWALAGTLSKDLAEAEIMYGLIGLTCMDVLLVFSTEYWRKTFYNIFLASHVAGFSVLLAAMWLHMPGLFRYVIATVVVYGFDHLFRAIRTRITIATLHVLPELGIVRMEFPGINSGWRAGQHMRLRVLSFGMGMRGICEIHPFTIASAPKTEEGLVLMIKKTGTWTNKLYGMARAGDSRDGERRVAVMIDGPYGGPGDAIFSSYSAATFVCGGSGITFALSTIQDLIKKDLRGQSRVKCIDLIWTVQDASALVPMVPQLTNLIQQSIYTPVTISVHYTRATVGKFPFKERRSSSKGEKYNNPLESQYNFIPGLTLSAGRPKILKTLETTLSRAVQLGHTRKDREPLSGVLVGVCGPVALADDVTKAVAWLDPVRRDQVGGVEVHEE
ncbi:hypothetical protein FISHEDRAFT_35808 [Fistulina hepatica ATCC 64428]|uniref:ferric-chelate reductase (NADPH) n=1 Tax=Fistulina hepatica ATCC 64428 TaxID=1128425 RepID=A0A0D7AKQ5_9AGAR|nr:hypothetical protein FISHEDRAFT_35808 [Fistulina hepatica ATCC 64428]